MYGSKNLQNLVAAFQECAINWNEFVQKLGHAAGGGGQVGQTSDLAWNLHRLAHYGR